MTPSTDVLSLAAGALCASVTVVVLRRYRLYSRHVRLPFAVLNLACAVWAAAYGFQLLSTTLEAKLLWYFLTWVGAAFAPTLWFAFTLAYAGDGDAPTRRTAAALCVEPALVVLGVAAAVTGSNRLFVAGFERAPTTAGAAVDVAHGPLYGVHLLYAVSLAVAGTVLMGRLLVRGDGTYRRGTLVLLSAASVPLFAFAAANLRLFPPSVHPTPVALGVSAVVVLLGLRNDDLFDVTPVARDLVIAEMRDGIVVLDDRGRVVESNPAASPLFTVPREDAVGAHVADVCGNALGMLALLDGGRDRLDVALDGDGGRRYYEATATPIGGDGGHEQGWTLVLRDTTERRRTEAKFRALIENSRDLISVVDADGVRRYTSPASEHMLGVPRDEFEGESVFGRMHPDDRDRVRAAFEEAVESDAPTRSEFRLKHADGSWRVLDSVAVGLLDDPAVGGVVVNSRDVTSRRRYEQRLRVLNRILRHDLRNDMNVVLGHADLLDGMVEDPEKRLHVRTIRRKARSLVSLGERAREIDRTVTREDRELRPVEITGVVREKLADLRESNPSLVVDTHLPEEALVLATSHVGTAIESVLDNAVEHNDRALRRVGVAVSAPVDADGVEVRVVDNGPGIPAAELAPLESGTETQLQHGSGLGLWLVKWILTSARASVEFEDRTARGTAVVMRFRTAAPDRTRDESDENDAGDTDTRRTSADGRATRAPGASE